MNNGRDFIFGHCGMYHKVRLLYYKTVTDLREIFYYKMRRLLQNAHSATVFTSVD